MSDSAPLSYSDNDLRDILQSVRTIAVVGASANPHRPSHFVTEYMNEKGYRTIPVNPGLAGQTLLGEMVYADLASIPGPVDMVQIFRHSEAVPPIVEDAIAISAKVVWMQLGVRHDTAAAKAQAAGLRVVMDRCTKIEFSRLGCNLEVKAGQRPPQ